MNKKFENQERLLFTIRTVHFCPNIYFYLVTSPFKNPPLSDAGKGGRHAYTLPQNSASYQCYFKCLLGQCNVVPSAIT